MTRQRLVDIIVTALIGACIAFFQSLLFQTTGSHLPAPDPAVAGVAAGGLKYYFNNPLRA
jgi:hypothetical protein